MRRLETNDPPICVDLDGTLIRTDLLVESLIALARHAPLALLLVPVWLLRGRSVLKDELARRVTPDPAKLPYRAELVEWLEAQRREGRRLWLCTASHRRLAEGVAAHLGIFEGVVASDRDVNAVAGRKAALLVERFGERAFDYCGDSIRDVAVWRHARAAIPCGSPALARAAGRVATVERRFGSEGGRLRALARALRPHQWAKNVLVFIPVAAAHRAGDLRSLGATVLAFASFSACASSAYVLNDLLDVEADRKHPRKRTRPFASGALSPATGLALAPALLVVAALLAAPLPPLYGAVLAGYYALTLAYSFRLKRVLLLDTLTLAALYTIRLVGGGLASDVALSFWLLLMSVFLFLSLALVKRYAELAALRKQGEIHASGRGYQVDDLPLLHSLGAAAGYVSVLVLALYINSHAVETLYRRPKAFWGLCVVMLYWVSRVWMKAHRGEMHDDPVVWALRDRVSRGLGVLAVAIVLIAV